MDRQALIGEWNRQVDVPKLHDDDFARQGARQIFLTMGRRVDRFRIPFGQPPTFECGGLLFRYSMHRQILLLASRTRSRAIPTLEEFPVLTVSGVQDWLEKASDKLTFGAPSVLTTYISHLVYFGGNKSGTSEARADAERLVAHLVDANGELNLSGTNQRRALRTLVEELLPIRGNPVFVMSETPMTPSDRDFFFHQSPNADELGRFLEFPSK
jgi:hypothetical protein